MEAHECLDRDDFYKSAPEEPIEGSNETHNDKDSDDGQKVQH